MAEPALMSVNGTPMRRGPRKHDNGIGEVEVRVGDKIIQSYSYDDPAGCDAAHRLAIAFIEGWFERQDNPL